MVIALHHYRLTSSSLKERIPIGVDYPKLSATLAPMAVECREVEYEVECREEPSVSVFRGAELKTRCQMFYKPCT